MWIKTLLMALALVAAAAALPWRGAFSQEEEEEGQEMAALRNILMGEEPTYFYMRRDR